MYIATHTRVTRDIHILAQFIKYHIVIHIKMIKKWKTVSGDSLRATCWYNSADGDRYRDKTIGFGQGSMVSNSIAYHH